jgi:hypothetical protein
MNLLIRHPSDEFFLRSIAIKILLGFSSIAPLAQAAESTLCASDENIIFSCELKNKKIVSVCSSSSPKQDHIDYRFGKKSKVELSYSANTQLPTQKFHRGEIVYANNSEDVLWFKKGNYRYTVYSPIRGDPGLSVALNGDVITRLECNNSSGGTTDSPKTSSPFIVEHGTADLMTFEELWKD